MKKHTFKLSFVLVTVFASSFAFHSAFAADKQGSDTPVKNPERFTKVKEWDLTFTWQISDTHKNVLTDKNSRVTTTANVEFSGTLKTVLKRDENSIGFNWSNKQDNPIQTISYKANKTIDWGPIAPNTYDWVEMGDKEKEAAEKRKGKEENQSQDFSDADFLVDLDDGTYDFSGNIRGMAKLTTGSADYGTQNDEDVYDVFMRCSNKDKRKKLELPESGTEISGTETFEGSIAPFNNYNSWDNIKMPEMTIGIIPWTKVAVTWSLKPRESLYKLMYDKSDRNIAKLKYISYGYDVISTNVGIEPFTKAWFLHSNMEGQVLIDSKKQLDIDTAKKLVEVRGKFGIIRLARSWILNYKRSPDIIINGEHVQQYSKYSRNTNELKNLDFGWHYDTLEVLNDWLDNAAMAPFTNWEDKAVVDEFLIGVSDLDHPERNSSPLDKNIRSLPDDTFLEKICGMPEFQYMYVAFAIETKAPTEDHPMVFRITYSKPEKIGLEKYKKYYKASEKPNYEFPWDADGDWQEIKPAKGGWTVVKYP